MNKEQKTFLKARYKQFYVIGWDELLIKLKRHGGEMIVPMPEPEEHVQQLLKGGRIFDNTKLILEKGESNRCHQNASRLWAENEQLQLVTGYALHQDHSGSPAELWRQHSWCWNPNTGKLIETTVPAKKYFGVAMDEFSALRFAINNVPEYDDPKYVPRRVEKRAFEFLEHILKQEDLFLASLLKICLANKTIGKLKYKVSKKAELALLGASMLRNTNKGMKDFIATRKNEHCAACGNEPARKPAIGKKG